MKTTRTTICAITPSVIGLVTSAALWSRMPDRIPIHWDAHGEPDGWAPKAIGLLLTPLIGLTIAPIVAWAMGQGTERRSVIDGSTLGIGAFLLGVHGLIVEAGLRPDAQHVVNGVFVLMGLLFLGLGLVMPHLSPNRWAGVRTPWTLGDEVVWKLTHRFARWTMGLAGVATVVAALSLSPPAVVGVSLALVLAGALLPAGYSYVLHRTRR